MYSRCTVRALRHARAPLETGRAVRDAAVGVAPRRMAHGRGGNMDAADSAARRARAVRVVICAVLFVLTGVVQTVAVQTLIYSGGSDSSTLLVALPQYLGNSLCYFLGRPIFGLLDRVSRSAPPPRAAGDANEAHRPQQTLLPAAMELAQGAWSAFASFWIVLLHRERRKLFVLTLNEVCGFVAGLVGLALAGSGLYQVVMSGATIFTALLSWGFLGKRLSASQWLSIFVISAGLSLTTRNPAITGLDLLPESWHWLFTSGKVHNDAALTLPSSWHSAAAVSIADSIGKPMGEQNASNQMHMKASSDSNFSGLGLPVGSHKGAAHTPWLSSSAAAWESSTYTGVALTMLSCLFFSLNYVIAEYFLGCEPDERAALPPARGMDLSLYTGFSCFVLFSVYVLVHTVPRWSELVLVPIEQQHGRVSTIVLCYVLHCVASFLHSVTYYDLLTLVGAVPIGVMNATRAVSVFAVSSLLFCSRQSSQCFTMQKGYAALVVASGAIGFSLSSRKSRPNTASAANAALLESDPSESKAQARIRMPVSKRILKLTGE
ncbi:hypothetical protein FVE85_7713 [Porphyridium purpureum]|uniref:Uncharacterized protein n=1 Tax=Porphyridium purpureum TaxID=35688 RepID=A0A5J4YJQ5_PORPP|nr:hypothetical protein FVE85_7713 [Porphyridium purpureum]|eukprot:POR1277..scf210_14